MGAGPQDPRHRSSWRRWRRRWSRPSWTTRARCARSGRRWSDARKAGALSGALEAEADALLRGLKRKGGAAEALARLAALLGDEPARRSAASAPALAAAAAQRDAETIELIGDFLEESGEGLARADETLLAVERNGPEPEKVHALFRVFHTIKGVAGFLELTDVVSLSHSTENLLNLVRDGRLDLRGDVFEAVFEATAVLRRLLQRLRAAVDAGVELQSDPEVAPLAARISALASKGRPVAATQPSTAAPSTPAPVASDPPAAPVGEAKAAPPPGSASQEPPPAPPSEPAAPRTAPEYVVRPARQSAAAEGAERPGTQLRETVKVDLERVDSMVEMIGELIIVESMVVNAPELAAGSARSSCATT